MPLLTIEWSLPLRKPQQRLPVLFSGPDNPQKLPIPVGDLDPVLYVVPFSSRELALRQHVDWFSRFCTVHPCDQHTDKQITLRVTSVAVGHICAMHAMEPINSKKNTNVRVHCGTTISGVQPTRLIWWMQTECQVAANLQRKLTDTVSACRSLASTPTITIYHCYSAQKLVLLSHRGWDAEWTGALH